MSVRFFKGGPAARPLFFGHCTPVRDDEFLDADRRRNPSLARGSELPERMATVNGVTRNATRRWRRACALGAALGALLCGGAAYAQQRPAVFQFDGDPPVKAFAAQRGGISLGQATSIARSRYPGRVVRAETVMMGDRVVYEIRILGDDGRVRTVRIDAQTGSFM